MDLTPGEQEVEIRFRFPGTEDLNAQLGFTAHADRQYTVRFDVYPPRPPKRTFGNTLSAEIVERDPRGVFLLPVTLPADFAYRAGAQGIRSAQNYSKRGVKWAYIDVISKDPSEGLVERVRVP